MITSLELELTNCQDQVERVRRETACTEGVTGSTDATLRNLSQLRREYTNLKLASVRDLGAMKVELSSLARLANSACLEVNKHVNIVKDDQGVDIRIGSLKELYRNYQAARKAKVDAEDRLEELERNLEISRKRVKTLEQRTLVPVAAQNLEIKQDTQLSSAQSERIVKLGKLEGENLLLRSSLQDIASMVEGGGLPTTLHGGKPRPVTPLRSRTRPPTPSRPASSARRRTRSLSPDLVESTVAAVQSVLNRNQVEAHALNARLTSLQEKLDLATAGEARWQAKSNELDLQLTAANQQLERLRLQDTDSRTEVDSLASKLKTMKREHDESLAKLVRMKQDLDAALQVNKDYAITTSKLERKASKLGADNGRLEERVGKLMNELKEAGLLISQLERVGSSLREESVELRQRLSAVERDQDRLERERTDTETIITEEKLQSSTVVSKLTRLEREEKVLRETILTLEATENKLKSEISMSEVAVAGLREQLAEADARIQTLESQVSQDKLAAQQREDIVSNLELEVRALKVEGAKLENEVTNLNLRRDAVQDQNSNLQEELKILKVRFLCSNVKKN